MVDYFLLVFNNYQQLRDFKRNVWFGVLDNKKDLWYPFKGQTWMLVSQHQGVDKLQSCEFKDVKFVGWIDPEYKQYALSRIKTE